MQQQAEYIIDSALNPCGMEDHYKIYDFSTMKHRHTYIIKLQQPWALYIIDPWRQKDFQHTIQWPTTKNFLECSSTLEKGRIFLIFPKYAKVVTLSLVWHFEDLVKHQDMVCATLHMVVIDPDLRQSSTIDMLGWASTKHNTAELLHQYFFGMRHSSYFQALSWKQRV